MIFLRIGLQKDNLAAFFYCLLSLKQYPVAQNYITVSVSPEPIEVGSNRRLIVEFSAGSFSM